MTIHSVQLMYVGYLLRVMSWYLIVLDHFYTEYSQSLNTLERKEVLWDRKKRKRKNLAMAHCFDGTILFEE